MFLLFSHTLTKPQIDDAKNSLGVVSFISLPTELQKLWSDVPPELESLEEYLKPIREFIATESKADDMVLIQGDFGVVYKMVDFCKSLKLKTLYATTKREAKEILQNDKIIKTSKFRHIRYREYK